MTILPALHTVIVGFVRRTWLVTMVAMLVCAVFAAHAVAAFVEADHLMPDPDASPHALVVKPKPAPAPLDPDVLGARNIFCSACTRSLGPGPAVAYSGQPAILIATSLGRDARATVRVIPTEVQGSWSLGETIPGVGKVSRIGGGSIDVVDGTGRTQQLSLLEAAGHGGTGAATSESGPAAPADPFEGRIKKLAEGSYEVDRELVRELVGAGAGAGAGMRAMPMMDHGEIKGLRLYGVKPTSVAGAIGLKSMDVLSGIDGEPIKTAQQLLDLYSKLDKLNGIELQGTRGTKPLAVSLKFR